MRRNLQNIISEPKGRAETIFDNLDISENTKKDYASRIGLFLSYVQPRGFNQQSYLHFKQYLQSRADYSVASKNKYLAASRVFLKELVKRGRLPTDITYGVKFFRQSKKHKRQGLTDREVRLLGVKLKYLPDTPRNSRLRALFSLLAYQGLRQIEITRLDVEDINLEKKIAYVQGKGEDEKELIYLTPATIRTLREYVKNCKPEGALFYSMGNRKCERLSTRTIKRELGAVFRELGYERTVHGLRHFYVTELLKNMDIRDVRKFSRHRSMEMLIIYDDEISLEGKAREVSAVMEKCAV